MQASNGERCQIRACGDQRVFAVWLGAGATNILIDRRA